VNEVYYPRVDIPQVRDLGFIVADGNGFWVEVKRMERHVLELAAAGTPQCASWHRHERFELTLRVAPCVHRDVLLIEVVLTGDETLRPYALLAPHLGGTGLNNRRPGRGITTGAKCYGPNKVRLRWRLPPRRNGNATRGPGECGIYRIQRWWQDFSHNGKLTWEYSFSRSGQHRVAGRVAAALGVGLAFGSSTEAATTLAFTALSSPSKRRGSGRSLRWTRWHANHAAQAVVPADLPAFVRGTVQALHHGIADPPGQDLSWCDGCQSEHSLGQHQGGTRRLSPRVARDLVECAGALLAVGATAKRPTPCVYLVATQHADGHWNQNQWLGGTSYGPVFNSTNARFPCCWLSCWMSVGRSAASKWLT